MTAKDIKDTSTRIHVEEMTALLHQFATIHELSADEVIAMLRNRRYNEEKESGNLNGNIN